MIHRSQRPSIELSGVALGELVLRKTGVLRSKPALVDAASGRSVTFDELDELVGRCAAGLHAHGFRREDVLALYAPNAIEFVIAFHAAARLGGATTTINPLATGDEALRQLVDSRARVLVAGEAQHERVVPLLPSTSVQRAFVLGASADAPSFTTLLGHGVRREQEDVDPARDVVALPYSSGTTGLPKGVMLTHANLSANVLQLAGTGQFLRDDVELCVLPMFHIYGLVAILNLNLHLGATVVILPRFDLEGLLATLRDRRVTVAPLVPPIVLQLVKHPQLARGALPALRTIMSGAAPLSAELTTACEERLGVRVIQGYGMTESSPATHVTPLVGSVAGSAGALVGSTEMRLVDPEAGLDAGPGATGEVWVRGPQVMRGYLNQPEATRATVDAERWLHTGDLGRVDANGQLFVVDRLKELIKYKGFPVAPAELEAVLVAHPAVLDAAVIPVPDDEAGEVPKAFVVRRAPVDAADLLAFVAERVAPYKRVAVVEFVDAIPKSPSGKILRRVLVEAERARRA
ncbi:MAG: AMP-binding protein [Planctomycetes bacterium]|nr:AMP-binding protein [Planctomycetota bacterium]